MLQRANKELKSKIDAVLTELDEKQVSPPNSYSKSRLTKCLVLKFLKRILAGHFCLNERMFVETSENPIASLCLQEFRSYSGPRHHSVLM